MLGVTCLATTVACGPSTTPDLGVPGDQVAQVGTELTIVLTGMDASGDSLTYSYTARDLMDLDGHAQISASRAGSGVFKWTPQEADVGMHQIMFSASNGKRSTTSMVNIDVRSAVSAVGAPSFRLPNGDGQTLDLTQNTCLDLNVAVDAADTARLALTQDEPVIDGAMLKVDPPGTAAGTTAIWHWCPTRDQQAESRYTLVLDANDGINPKLTKTYLLVLSGGSGASCPGMPPAISHTAMNVSSIAALPISTTITDDKGIKDAPLLYYSATPLATPPDLTKMNQLAMTRTSGTPTNGVYAASVPNPVATMAAGTKQTLYYVIVATDDDDTTGTCDHTTTSQPYTMTVTSTGTADQPVCSACTTDAQCGTGNECVRLGSSGGSYCLEACGTGCPTGYTCSITPVSSVGGAMAPQCVPDSGSCTMTTTSCMDDTWEVNDSRSDASHNPAMTPDTYDLVSCPSTTTADRANDDWFRIVVPSDQRVDLMLAGDPVSDLDLHLYHSDGTVISASTSLDPDEEISACLPAATYYVKVNGYGSARNPYVLSYDSHAESCNTTCVDDANEDDDTYSQAREITSPTYTSTGNMICPSDDDWFHVPLFTGDTMTVDLAFTQSNDTQDLDLHLYKDSVDLTPCDASDPSTCTIENGQSGSSNEHTTFTAPAGCDDGCDYYVVVRGFNNSSNAYGITIAVQ
ncbi:MAG TPA: PPC domain-containing protein [Kofleriaceae bacterium]|nr:PPC domain-containing protein [Kofleriaceae bacterium]